MLTLDQKLEKRFTDSSSDNSLGEELADFISFSVGKMEEKGYPPVILCSPKARFSVKEATRRNHPSLAVLSYLEIPSDISVLPLGEIRIEENTRLPGLKNEK